MTTRVTMIDRSLARIGQQAIMDDALPEYAPLVATWDSVTDSLLGGYPWSFCRARRRLDRLVAAPASHWKYAFQMPADLIGTPRRVMRAKDDATPWTDWELMLPDTAGEPRLLLADEPDLWMDYIKRAPPALWPVAFAETAVLAVAAEYALQVREDNALRARLRLEVYGDPAMPGDSGLLGVVRAQDAQGQPSPVIGLGRNPLITVRR